MIKIIKFNDMKKPAILIFLLFISIFLISTGNAATDKKISELDAITVVATNDNLVINVWDGTNYTSKRVNATNLINSLTKFPLTFTGIDTFTNNIVGLGPSNYLASVYSPTGSITTVYVGAIVGSGIGLSNLMGSNIVGSVTYATSSGSVTNVDSITNTWTVDTAFPVGFGTNLIATLGTVTGGFSGIKNVPASGVRYGELTIYCTGTLTLTNPAGWYTSDHVDTRIGTNGNVIEAALKVIVGKSTNLIIVQSSKR